MTLDLATERAHSLYGWLLVELDGSGPLPRAAEIAARKPDLGDAGTVPQAFDTLVRWGKIQTRHGTRSVARGHRIVWIRETGLVLATQGCPAEWAGDFLMGLNGRWDQR